jgi:hypothetical protein
MKSDFGMVRKLRLAREEGDLGAGDQPGLVVLAMVSTIPRRVQLILHSQYKQLSRRYDH